MYKAVKRKRGRESWKGKEKSRADPHSGELVCFIPKSEECLSEVTEDTKDEDERKESNKKVKLSL
jgi:hypothetical protein